MTVTSPEALLDRILAERIIAVLRFAGAQECLAAASSVAAGGVSVLEVTLTTPGALDVLQELASRPELVAGVGSVRSVADLHRAADAGARFMASPVLDEATVAAARERGLVTMPGALTPTEIDRAARSGSDLVKLFPMPPDGAAYIRSILGPMPELRLAPSGGVTPETASAYLAAGAVGLNVGSWLTHEAGRVAPPDVIARRAAALVAAVFTRGMADGAGGDAGERGT